MIERVSEKDPLGIDWTNTIPDGKWKLLEKRLDARIKKKEKPLSGFTGLMYRIDQELQKFVNRSLPFPDWYPKEYPLFDHPIVINKNLYISYPYGFYQNQFKTLVKKANENGFYVKVDSICSRFTGGYLRVIVWKPTIAQREFFPEIKKFMKE